MPRLLPRHPSIEQLRTQARDLLRAYRVGNQAAHARVALQRLTPASGADELRLAAALTVVAREYGFASWPKLKQHLEALPPTARPTPPPAPPPRSPRRQAVLSRAARVTAAAEQGDLAALLDSIFAPAWEMEAVRAELLAQPAYERIIATLLGGADDARPHIRFLAVQALDHFADQRCAPTLRRLIDDPVPRVRWAAIHALTCTDCKLTPLEAEGDLLPALIERALDDPSIRVRRVAAYSLGAICPDARAAAALETLAARETDVALLRNVRWAIQQQRRAAAS